MADNFGVAPDIGSFNRRLTELQRQIEALRSERRAPGTTVSTGDLTVENGGRVLVKGGGKVTVEGGILESVFIFLTSQLRPAGLLTKGIAPGDTWQIESGLIGTLLAGIKTNSASYPIALQTPSNDVRLDHSTTASAANTYIDATTGRVSRSTSSLRYKQDEQDHDVDPALVLQLRARSWRDRAEVEEDPDTERRYVGFIAEELHDIGLTEFVVYDADGEPEAIAYDRLAVALLALAKDQHSRLEDIEARLDRLET